MNLVRQQHAKGCGPACIAMILDCTYEEALDYFAEQNWSERGSDQLRIEALLVGLGFATRRLYRNDHNLVERSVWPPAPFAPMHICQVVTVAGGYTHFVIMDSAGLVFDPEHDGQRTLDDYNQVSHVVGLYRVEPKEISAAVSVPAGTFQWQEGDVLFRPTGEVGFPDENQWIKATNGSFHAGPMLLRPIGGWTIYTRIDSPTSSAPASETKGEA